MMPDVMPIPAPRNPTLPISSYRHPRTLRTAMVLLALWAGLALYPGTSEAFLSGGNLSNVTAQVAEIVIISVGMTFIMLTGGIDLSVGAGMAWFGTIAATLQIDHHQPAWVAVLAVLAAAVVVGLWHGLLVAKLGVPPFIATLSGFLSYRGIGLILSNARGLSPMSSDFHFLGGRIGPLPAAIVCLVGLGIGIAIVVTGHRRRRQFGLPEESPWIRWSRGLTIGTVALFGLWIYREGMPVPVLIASFVTAIGALLLRASRLGRYAFAVGGNAEAARLSGIPVVRVKVAVYVMTTVLTSIAALIVAARTNGVTPGNMGLNRELHVITAVVIGGTSLSGGRATMLGTLLGALIFGTLSNGMNLLGINSNWQLIITGMILLGASLLDSWSIRSEHA
jgi:ribose/xylose/arabinose/galactoside ABC-type transport system permease subunit